MPVNDTPKPRLTARRLALHMAPAAFAWFYFGWLVTNAAGDTRHWFLLARLYPLQIVVALLAFAGALFATRLPAAKGWRVLLIIVSLSGGYLLALARYVSYG